MFRTTVTGGQLVYNCRLPATSCFLQHVLARVVELVDAGDSKSPAARRAGSSPASGTTIAESPPRRFSATPAGRLFPIIGGTHSLDTIDHSAPTSLGQDSHAVIRKVPEPICTA